MGTKDLLIYESGNGGSLFFMENKSTFVEKLYYKVYLSLFGGNVEASTKGNELLTDERKDWWGNSLFFLNSPKKQFNSETERVLKKVSFNSQGRGVILSAIQNDLKYLGDLATFEINVVILSFTQIEITVEINKPINLKSNYLKLVWDNAKNEVILAKII
jgi:hypothetical protein